MPLRRSSIILNLGQAETWNSGLANESLEPTGELKYEATFDAIAPLVLPLRSQSPLQRERELEQALSAILPTSEPEEARVLPLDVEVCIPVAESSWMPQAALRIMREWTHRLGRPDARCMIWNIRSDRDQSHGCGVLCWNGQLLLNLTGYAVECLVNNHDQAVMNSCPIRKADDGAIELLLEPGFWNDVAVCLTNAIAKDEKLHAVTMFLPAAGPHMTEIQMQQTAVMLLSRVYQLCFGTLGRSCPGSAMTRWNP